MPNDTLLTDIFIDQLICSENHLLRLLEWSTLSHSSLESFH